MSVKSNKTKSFNIFKEIGKEVKKSNDTEVKELSDIEVKESNDIEVKESNDTEVKESKDTEVKGYNDTEVKESNDTEVKESSDTEVKESSDTEVKESSDTEVKESNDTEVKESSDIKIKRDYYAYQNFPASKSMQGNKYKVNFSLSKEITQKTQLIQMLEGVNVRENSKIAELALGLLYDIKFCLDIDITNKSSAEILNLIGLELKRYKDEEV